jgi:hypothetical protein
MIEFFFVMLVTHLKSLVGNIVGMTHAIFKIKANVKKIYFFFQRQCVCSFSRKSRSVAVEFTK